MRLIDADEAIEQIDDIFSVCGDKGLLPSGITKALVRSLLSLENITPTVGGWISVKDKRPDGHTLCLGYGMGEYFLMHVRNDGWIQPIVTHWMPLPEPPKEEQ